MAEHLKVNALIVVVLELGVAVVKYGLALVVLTMELVNVVNTVD
jgi:hypothetical protein